MQTAFYFQAIVTDVRGMFHTCRVECELSYGRTSSNSSLCSLEWSPF